MSYRTPGRIHRTLITSMPLDMRTPPPTCGICEMYPQRDLAPFRITDDPHPTCAGCGIRFGGTHAGGSTVAARGQEGLCAFCAARRSKIPPAEWTPPLSG